MSDPRYWQWWTDKLAGIKVPASEGTPYAGFYRWVRKSTYGGTKWAIPIAYWPGENGELHCREGDKDVPEARGRDIWVNVHNNPVLEEWYREVAENEEPEWPDGMATSPPKGDNRPPSEASFEWLQESIKDLSALATKRLEGEPITVQPEADRVSNLADQLSEFWKKADEARKAERAPHDEALKVIQLKWSPLLMMAETYKNLKFKLLTPWQIAQSEAQKKEAEAAAAAGEPVPEQSRRPRAGTRGRAMTLKSFKSAKITDFDICLKFFKDSPDVRAAVQDLANKAIRAGITVPGAEVVEEQRTV